jgi:hypothetical protein
MHFVCYIPVVTLPLCLHAEPNLYLQQVWVFVIMRCACHGHVHAFIPCWVLKIGPLAQHVVYMGIKCQVFYAYGYAV